MQQYPYDNGTFQAPTPAPRRSGLMVVGMIFSIIAFIAGLVCLITVFATPYSGVHLVMAIIAFLFGLLGLIFSAVGKGKSTYGRGMGVTGIVLGIIALVIATFYLILIIIGVGVISSAGSRIRYYY